MINIKYQVSFLLLLILGLNYNILLNQYAIDDSIAYTENAYVKKGVYGVKEALTKPYFSGSNKNSEEIAATDLPADRWRPLFILFMTLEKEIIGFNPIINHAISLFLYSLNIFLLFHFLRSFVFKSKPILAFFACVLFVLLPIHSEVIANIKSQDELLAFTFGILSLIYSLKYTNTFLKRNLSAGFIFYLVSIFCKESAVTFFFVIPLSMYFLSDIKLKFIIKYACALAFGFGIYLVLRFQVTGVDFSSSTMLYNDPYLLATFSEKYSTILFVIIYNLKLLIFPTKFSWDYQYEIFPYLDINHFKTWYSILLLGILAFISLYLLKRKHLLSYGIIFFFSNFILVSNLVINLGSYLDERCLYLPSVGYVIFIISFIDEIYIQFMNKKIIISLLIFICVPLSIFYSYKKIVRNSDWKDSETLMRKDSKNFPNNGKLQGGMGEIYLRDYLMQESIYPDILLDSAVNCFTKAIEIYPEDLASQFALAAIFDYKNEKNSSDSVQSLVKKHGHVISNGSQSIGLKTLRIGLWYEENNNLELADSCYFKANNIYPYDKDIAYTYAHFLYNKAEFKKALSYALVCFNAEQSNFQYKKIVDDCYLKIDSMNNPDQFEDYFKDIEKLRKGDLEDYFETKSN